MHFWNQRYSEPGFAYGTEPNTFLAAHAPHIPPGRVLCLADGEGRNSVFLAKQGYAVHAVDLSEVGLAKARAYASEQGVELTTECADLSVWTSPPEVWDGVISIFAHFPAPVRQALHTRLISALKPGGILLLEAYTEQQLETTGVGGPGAQQRDLFMSAGALTQELQGLDILRAQELTRELNEGTYHQGTGAVVQVIARKKRTA